MKLLRFFTAIIISTVLLLGCAPQEEQPDETSTPAQSAAGGVAAYAENINVKDIDITLDGDETVIILSMLSGSRAAGYTESKLVKPPEYEVFQLDQPQRLVIRLEDISFWDYEQRREWALSDFVLGVFREVPADNDSLLIYIQLSRQAEFSVEENEGDLVIRLSPGIRNESSMFYCVSNSFYEHQDGTWPDSIDMMPVLCSDSISRMLISKPFDTRQAAEIYMQGATEILAKVLPEKALFVALLPANSLPYYTADADYLQISDRNVVMKDGVLMQTLALIQNGKYLAASADGRIAFSRSYKPEEPALEQDIYLLSERLWILDPNGRTQSIDVPEFFFIDEAAFSIDGRYICILDVSIENRVLYVYDFERRELVNLGEEGFGNQTAAFAWSDADNKLYAMTGYGSMQMRVCEFLSDGTIELGTVEEEAGSEGELAISQGRLFFADNFAGYSGIIYEIYEIGETRREITQGVAFRISPDGKTMLVLEASSSEEEQVLVSLKLCDIETGKETYITQDTDIIDFYFMQSGGKVYYTTELFEDVTNGYEFGLFSYDRASGAAKQIALCSTGEFVPSTQSGKIYLIDYVEDTDNNFYATYVYDLSS